MLQIEPFQSEPHLLDTKLKTLLPPIVDAYLTSLLKSTPSNCKVHIDIRTALASILYTLCKVRGAKVIVGFLNNEPRYLEPILDSLERVASEQDGQAVNWKVPYVLLLWLSHLLLAPFALASISSDKFPDVDKLAHLSLSPDVPPVAQRITCIGIGYLSASTKAQDAAAAMLVRLATRPDMQQLKVADALVDYAVGEVSASHDLSISIYQQLGPLRFLAGVATSADLGHLIPKIYRACGKLITFADASPVASNAVGKKLALKIYRNIAILTLRSSSVSGPLLSFLETTDVLEDVIDHLLQSLGDRDTPVRYAAAKAISLIISELEPEMGFEVIQAVLDTFKEDIPRNAAGIDYQTVNALKWHGLTLALSHALFKRSASPTQLPDILNALVSALNFEQRTATGSSIGANVRDAANFGIWSLSRRYTSDELLSVDTQSLRFNSDASPHTSVIQAVAVQLLLSACLDPAGNIRRGSSAALQELIGRHPNRVIEGIAVVQIVDYQAVGLRRRGLIDVANKAAALHVSYWQALIGGLVDWRGLRSVDIPSREAAARSLANLVSIQDETDGLAFISERLLAELETPSGTDIESLHGLICALSNLLEGKGETKSTLPLHRRFWHAVQSVDGFKIEFGPRALKSELPVALAKLIAEVCCRERTCLSQNPVEKGFTFASLEDVAKRLLTRHEDPILQVLPEMAKQVYGLRKLASRELGCMDVVSLARSVEVDGSKATLNGAGRAIALGSLVSQPAKYLVSEEADAAISSLNGLVTAMNVEWRIIGLRALSLALQRLGDPSNGISGSIAAVVQTIHIGLTDYTIDERGDIGSLVRLQGLNAASSLLQLDVLSQDTGEVQLLQSDILRLSLEKLDRVRGRAAACRQQCLPSFLKAEHQEDTNSEAYLQSALRPVFEPSISSWARRALLEGAISCAGIGAESLLQTSRAILTGSLWECDMQHLHSLLTSYADIMRDLLSPSAPNASNLMVAALDLLAFFLDMRIPQRLAQAEPAFKWRTLLSTVQKSHHKSSDVPKLLAAVNVYRGLAEVESIRGEVVKKLLSMLATSPYPRVKVAVAEVTFDVLGQDAMKVINWTEKGPEQSRVLGELKAVSMQAL